MKGRRLVKISRIGKTMKDGDIEGDWVTVGVLVEKIPQKTTANGKNFSGNEKNLSSIIFNVDYFLNCMVFVHSKIKRDD